MTLERLLDRFLRYGDAPALDGPLGTVTYGELLHHIGEDAHLYLSRGLVTGSSVRLTLDVSPENVARFLALARMRCVIAPCGPQDVRRTEQIEEIVAPRYVVHREFFCEAGSEHRHPLFERLREEKAPGVVLMTSGSTGRPKAVVHDLHRLLQRFERPGRALRTAIFMTPDHIGGLNSLLYTLAYGGTAIALPERDPASVLAAIERYRIEVLPTTPSFLRLALASEAFVGADLGSLKLITYGGEPMPGSTLDLLRQALPRVELLQQFGMTETGVLRSRMREDGWIRLGGDGYEVRVVEGRLQVRAHTAMLGYLNAPCPFTPDGWLETDDLAETDGDYLRVLGRASEILNVGGEKVSPAEVEEVLETIDGVHAAVVHGEENGLVGQILCATVNLTTAESAAAFRKRMRAALVGRLPAHRIPSRVIVTDRALVGDRNKKLRILTP